MAETRTKAVGRPRKTPEEGCRIGHSLRVKPSVDAALRVEADRACRSIAEEIDFRVTRSFEAVVVKPPRDVVTALGRAAARNGRSLEDEVLARLEVSLARDGAVDGLASDDLFDKVVDAVAGRIGAALVGRPRAVGAPGVPVGVAKFDDWEEMPPRRDRAS